jgi:polyphosphate glucokinase
MNTEYVAGVARGAPVNTTRTLAIDVGGTGLKAAVLDATGAMISERARVPTPHPCSPERLVSVVSDLVAPLPSYGRVSVGFPGMVRRGCVLSAPSLSRVAGPGSEVSADLRRAWDGVDMVAALEDALGAPPGL